MELKFRKLRADEIEVRVGEKKNGYVSLLLYQDARCARNILNETVGATGWVNQFQSLPMTDREITDKDGRVVCTQKVNSVFCGIAIKDESGVWLWRWDCGSEGNFEREKAIASDSFKRAAVMWGVAVELYTAPRIWIKDEGERYWSVSKIGYQEGRISDLRIVDSKGKVVFDYENFETQRLASPEDKSTEDVLELLAQVCKELQDTGEERKELGKFYRYYQEKLPTFNNPSRQTVLRLWKKWIAREY